MNKIFLLALTSLIVWSCNTNKKVEDVTISTSDNSGINKTSLPQNISKVQSKIVLDALGSESDWDKSTWRNMDQLMLGTMPSKEDFNGRYKLLWDEDFIYILAEIEDDVFMDIHEDPLDRYWDDDCLEIFVDADRSKGNHQYNYNAFAYHISLNNDVVDISDDEKKAKFYNDHVEVSKYRKGNSMTWEIAVKIYSDKFNEKDPEASRVKLMKKNQIGLMVAYCDNDGSEEREHFMGDMFIPGEDKNKAWIDAGVFGQLNLKK